MSDTERGKIFNPALAAQLRNFSGLRYGKITPTDIDAFIDFSNLLFVFIEAKLPNVELSCGQRLAIERVVMASASKQRHSTAIICEHHNRVGAIDFATCKVTRVYWKSNNKWEWRAPSIAGLTVRGAIDRFLQYYGLNQYIDRTKSHDAATG